MKNRNLPTVSLLMVDDRTALLRGIAALPEADLPRLVYADWLEEHDDPEQAAFIRAQVECHTLPPWDTFAVYCRHRRREWFTGAPWLATLPPLMPGIAEWSENPFRRGLGWSVKIRQLSTFLDTADELFRIAPIGELHLPTATLEDWERLLDQPWLKQIESIHFYGIDSPIEAVRLLLRHPQRTNIREISLEQSSRPAIPVLIEDLVQSPLGARIKRWHLKVGPHDSMEIVQALTSGQLELEELSFQTYQFDADCLDELAESGLLTRLKRLELTTCYLHQVAPAFTQLLANVPFEQLEQLALRKSPIRELDFERIGLSPAYTKLRLLDFSGSTIGWLNWHDVLLAPYWTELASFRVADTGIIASPLEMRELIQKGRFWKSLVELDLRDTYTNANSIDHFVQAEMPPNLTALLFRKPTGEYSAKAPCLYETEPLPEAMILE